jgi:hypothetical protein
MAYETSEGVEGPSGGRQFNFHIMGKRQFVIEIYSYPLDHICLSSLHSWSHYGAVRQVYIGGIIVFVGLGFVKV